MDKDLTDMEHFLIQLFEKTPLERFTKEFINEQLELYKHDIQNNEAAVARMKADYEKYSAAVQRDKDGNPINNLTLDNCKFKDEQNMGIHLQGMAQRTDTHGQYVRVG